VIDKGLEGVDHEIEEATLPDRLQRTSIDMYLGKVTAEVPVTVVEDDPVKDVSGRTKTPKDTAWSAADRGRRQKNWMPRWTTTGEVLPMRARPQTMVLQWPKRQDLQVETTLT